MCGIAYRPQADSDTKKTRVSAIADSAFPKVETCRDTSLARVSAIADSAFPKVVTRLCCANI